MPSAPGPTDPEQRGKPNFPKATCLSRKRTNNRYWARHLYPTDREGNPALASPHKQSQQDASALVRASRMTNQTLPWIPRIQAHSQAHRRQAPGESQVRRPTPRSEGPSPVVLLLQQRVPRPLAMGVYRVDGLAAWTPVSLRPFPYHHRLPSRCVVSEFTASTSLSRVWLQAFPAQWVADGRTANQATSLRSASATAGEPAPQWPRPALRLDPCQNPARYLPMPKSRQNRPPGSLPVTALPVGRAPAGSTESSL